MRTSTDVNKKSVQTIYYLKEGQYTPPLGVWNLGPRIKLGVYLKKITVTIISKIAIPNLS